MTDHIATMWKYQRTRRHGSEWLTKQRSVAGKRRGGGLTEHDCLFLPYQDLGKPCHLSRVQLPSLRSLAHVIQLMRLVMIGRGVIRLSREECVSHDRSHDKPTATTYHRHFLFPSRSSTWFIWSARPATVLPAWHLSNNHLQLLIRSHQT